MKHVSLEAAFASLNEVSTHKIETLTTRDGRTIAKLPRVGRDVVIGPSQFNPEIKMTPTDVAWLCEEARLAMAPAHTLLDAALASLKEVAAV